MLTPRRVTSTSRLAGVLVRLAADSQPGGADSPTVLTGTYIYKSLHL